MNRNLIIRSQNGSGPSEPSNVSQAASTDDYVTEWQRPLTPSIDATLNTPNTDVSPPALFRLVIVGGKGHLSRTFLTPVLSLLLHRVVADSLDFP